MGAIAVRAGMYRARMDETSLLEEILRLYFDELCSLSEVGHILGLSQWKVTDRIRRAGFGIRSKNWRAHERQYALDESVADTLTPRLAWVLGWIVSDGYVRESTFGWRLAARDIDVLEQFRDFFAYAGPIYHFSSFLARTGRSYPMVHLKISSLKLVATWATYGILPNKTTRERYPADLLLSRDEEIHRCFIRGVFEGDGSILLEGKSSLLFQIVGCRELLHDIQKMLVRYLRVTETKLTNNIVGQNHFALRYRGRFQALRIFDWLYAGSQWHLKRKHDRYLEIRKLLGRST